MSQRIDQLNRLIQREIAALIRREIEFPLDTIVTVTRASVADDAESAKLWISVLPFDHAEDALAQLNRQIAELQHLLNKRLVMKFVPKIRFALDTREQHADQVSHILDTLTDADLGMDEPPAPKA